MKSLIPFILLSLCAVSSVAQTRFSVSVTGLKKEFILVEKPFRGQFFPAAPQKVLANKRGKFQIEIMGSETGFMNIYFGDGHKARVFLEPGRSNSLYVDLSNFERSLSFDGPQAAQNQFLNELGRRPLTLSGGDMLAARSFGDRELTPKEHYFDMVDHIEAEKKILGKKGKKKFSEAFTTAVQRDIVFYYTCVFSMNAGMAIRALNADETPDLHQKWAYYWSKAFEKQLFRQRTSTVSEYYTLALDFYLADFRLDCLGDILYDDPNKAIGEQFLEYDRILWEELDGKQLEYALAAVFSQRALMGNNEIILSDLFEKYKNDFPASPYLGLFERAVSPIKEISKEEATALPEGVVDMGRKGEINSMEELIGQFAGKVVYVDIWATWCNPCLFEFRLKKPLENFVAGKDIALLFISVDDEDRREKWRKTIVENNLKGHHLLANFSLRDELIDRYGDGSNLTVPRYLIFDKYGKLVDGDAKQPSQNSNLFKDLMRYY